MQLQIANYKWDCSNQIGKGAFGRVYKGNSIKSGEEVAIKCFQFTLNCYMNREAETMKLAAHQNIVKFLGLEQTDQKIPRRVLIMEYCPAGDLQEFIDSRPNGLPPMEFLRLSDNLISATKHLFEKSLVHRDIKPSNILFSTHVDGTSIYKLADFGAARVLMPDESYGSLYGTYEYVHPDIFAKFYAHDLDIRPPSQYFNRYHEFWSIGVTLFEAASGRLPFNPKNGRPDRKAMYKMISQKQNDQISAKEVAEGQIEYSTELPENCAISDEMKHDITNLLVLLMSSKESPFVEASGFLKSAREKITIKSNKVPMKQTKLLRRRANTQKENQSPVKNVLQLRSAKKLKKHQVPMKKKCLYRAGKNNWWRVTKSEFFINFPLKSHFM